jgi:hypothetical protein
MDEQPQPAASPAPAPPVSAARRLAAMIGIVILLGLAGALIWRVYLHHERSNSLHGEPDLVAIRACRA